MEEAREKGEAGGIFRGGGGRRRKKGATIDPSLSLSLTSIPLMMRVDHMGISLTMPEFALAFAFAFAFALAFEFDAFPPSSSSGIAPSSPLLVLRLDGEENVDLLEGVVAVVVVVEAMSAADRGARDSAATTTTTTTTARRTDATTSRRCDDDGGGGGDDDAPRQQ